MAATKKTLEERLNDFQQKILTDHKKNFDEVLSGFKDNFKDKFSECSYLLPIVASYYFLICLQDGNEPESSSSKEEKVSEYQKNRDFPIPYSGIASIQQTCDIVLGSVTHENYHKTLETLLIAQREFICCNNRKQHPKGEILATEWLQTLNKIHKKSYDALPSTPSPTKDKEKNKRAISDLVRTFSGYLPSPRKKSPSPPTTPTNTAEENETKDFSTLSQDYQKLLEDLGVSPKITTHCVSSTPSLKKSV